MCILLSRFGRDVYLVSGMLTLTEERAGSAGSSSSVPCTLTCLNPSE
jgi:hypothetical protein